jgi:hypothetical protein
MFAVVDNSVALPDQANQLRKQFGLIKEFDLPAVQFGFQGAIQVAFGSWLGIIGDPPGSRLCGEVHDALNWEAAIFTDMK